MTAPDRRPAAPRFALGLAFAAALLLGLSGLLLWWAWSGIRASSEAIRGGAGAIELVSPKGDATSRPITFVWRAAPEPARYTVEVSTAEGESVYRTEVGDTAVALPGNIALVPGQEYHWFVSVRLADGSATRSPIARFRP